MAREWQSNQVDALVDDQGDLRTGTVWIKSVILNILDQVLTNGLFHNPASDTQPYLRPLGGLLAWGAGVTTALSVALKHDATGGTDALRARTPADDGDVPMGGANPSQAHHFATKSYVDTLVAGGIPSGAMMSYGAAAAPSGWLLCQGQAISRTTYADLFAVIGTTYGVGDGSTTFNVPDLQQRFPLGKAASGTGSTLGGSGGAIDHKHSYSQVPLHAHGITDPGHTHQGYVKTLGEAGVTRDAPSDSGSGGTPVANSITTATTGVTVDNAGVASPETEVANPPYLVVNWIIKA